MQKLLAFYSESYPSVQKLLVLDSETDLSMQKLLVLDSETNMRPPKESVWVHFQWLEVQEMFLSSLHSPPDPKLHLVRQHL